MPAPDPTHNLPGSGTARNASGGDGAKRDPTEQFRRDRDRERACGAATSHRHGRPQPCKGRSQPLSDHASSIRDCRSRGGLFRAADRPASLSSAATIARTHSVETGDFVAVKTRASHPRLIGHGLRPSSRALLCGWQPSVLIQVKFEPVVSEMQRLAKRRGAGVRQLGVRALMSARCAAGDWARTGLLSNEKKGAQRDDEPWDATKRFSYHLIRPSFGGSLSDQCRERRSVWAIFLPRRIGRILCELVLAPPFASTDRAYPLKISHDLRVGMGDCHPVELDLVHAPIQQIRSVRPFAGENGEIGSANADVARDAVHLGRTATIKVRHSPAAAVPASPPMREPTNKTGPFAYLSRPRHCSLRDERALLRVETTQRRAVAQQDPAPLWHLDRRRVFQMLERARNGLDGEAEIVGDILTRHR